MGVRVTCARSMILVALHLAAKRGARLTGGDCGLTLPCSCGALSTITYVALLYSRSSIICRLTSSTGACVSSCRAFVKLETLPDQPPERLEAAQVRQQRQNLRHHPLREGLNSQ